MVDGTRSRIFDKTSLTDAINALDQEQQRLRESCDNVTGAMLARHFELSVLVVGKPRVRQDTNSTDISLVTYFSPLESVTTPTDNHLRMFCSCLRVFVAVLLDLDETNNATNSTNCEWDEVDNNNVNSTSTNNNNGNTYSVILNYPASLVQQNLESSNSTTLQSPTSRVVKVNDDNNMSSPLGGNCFLFLIIFFFFLF